MKDMDHPKYERTFILIKPDGVQRSLVGEIIKRIERTGLKMVGLKMFVPTREQALEHYRKDDEWCQVKGEVIVENMKAAGLTPEKPAIEYGRDIIEANCDLITAGPCIAMVWEGNQSVGVVKKIVGSTEPTTSDVGTIRGDLTIDSYPMANNDNRAVRNLVHCSDETGEAKREISLWFSDEELVNYKLIAERMLYDVNLDGMLE